MLSPQGPTPPLTLTPTPAPATLCHPQATPARARFHPTDTTSYTTGLELGAWLSRRGTPSQRQLLFHIRRVQCRGGPGASHETGHRDDRDRIGQHQQKLRWDIGTDRGHHIAQLPGEADQERGSKAALVVASVQDQRCQRNIALTG